MSQETDRPTNKQKRSRLSRIASKKSIHTDFYGQKNELGDIFHNMITLLIRIILFNLGDWELRRIIVGRQSIHLIKKVKLCYKIEHFLPYYLSFKYIFHIISASLLLVDVVILVKFLLNLKS